MPALPPVPQVLKVIVQGNTSEATPLTWANVLHFAYSGAAPSPATCVTIATDVQNAWQGHVAPLCPIPTVHNLCEVIDLTSTTAGSGVATASHAGTRGDDEIPANAACLVVYPINRRYRGGHPRSYLLVGGNADFLDAAHWSAAFTTEVTNAWKAFLGQIVGLSVAGTTINNAVNVSYYSGKQANGKPALRPGGPITDIINVSLCFAEQQMASQRRRIGRHRR